MKSLQSLIKGNVRNVSENSKQINNNSKSYDLTEILSKKETLSNPMIINKYTFSNLNFDNWIGVIGKDFHKVDSTPCLREDLIDKLSIVPTNPKEIQERQNFIKELYENEEFLNIISQGRISLKESFSWVNSITGNWDRKENQPYSKFGSYINFLDFIKNMKKACEIKYISILPLKEIGESIDENNSEIANKIIDYFLPLSREENFSHMHFNLANNWGDEKIRKKFNAAKYFVNVFKEFTSKNKEIFEHKRLLNLYKMLKISANTNCFHNICTMFNKKLERMFPVLNTLGDYFNSHELPNKAFNLWMDLKFFTGITEIMKNYEKKNNLPVVFPKILSKESRKAEIENGAELYLASTHASNEIQLNSISHNPKEHCFFITGPNGSAKTTYTRQIGQEYIIAMHGFPIIGNKAEISPVENIYTLFDKSDSPSQEMGTYETQLKRLDEILMKISPYSLVLLDEVDLGTDYSELKEATRITLDVLSKKGTTSYITSHLHDISKEVSENKFPKTINLASEVIKKEGKPYFTHKILRNKSEQSYGYLIRDKVGFNREKYK